MVSAKKADTFRKQHKAVFHFVSFSRDWVIEQFSNAFYLISLPGYKEPTNSLDVSINWTSYVQSFSSFNIKMFIKISKNILIDKFFVLTS